jgi:hypothetical protein
VGIKDARRLRRAVGDSRLRRSDGGAGPPALKLRGSTLGRLREKPMWCATYVDWVGLWG